MYGEVPDLDSEFLESVGDFFVGDETEDRVYNPNNTKIFAVQTICDYDADIIPCLNVHY